MKISYQHGIMVINGKRYAEDLVILGDEVYPNVVIKSVHLVFPEDIPMVLAFRPDVVVVGTGDSGMFMISREVQDYFIDNNITLIIQSTSEAVKTFQELSEKQKVAGIFHLTC